MIYRKLKRTWQHGYANHIPNFKKVFPELSNVDSEELCDRFIDLNMEFYFEEKTPVRTWVRFTMPLALIIIILMIIAVPIFFLFTGQWGYSLKKENRLLNWFRELKIQ